MIKLPENINEERYNNFQKWFQEGKLTETQKKILHHIWHIKKDLIVDVACGGGKTTIITLGLGSLKTQLLFIFPKMTKRSNIFLNFPKELKERLGENVIIKLVTGNDPVIEDVKPDIIICTTNNLSKIDPYLKSEFNLVLDEADTIFNQSSDEHYEYLYLESDDPRYSELRSKYEGRSLPGLEELRQFLESHDGRKKSVFLSGTLNLNELEVNPLDLIQNFWISKLHVISDKSVNTDVTVHMFCFTEKGVRSIYPSDENDYPKIYEAKMILNIDLILPSLISNGGRVLLGCKMKQQIPFIKALLNEKIKRGGSNMYTFTSDIDHFRNEEYNILIFDIRKIDEIRGLDNLGIKSVILFEIGHNHDLIRQLMQAIGRVGRLGEVGGINEVICLLRTFGLTDEMSVCHKLSSILEEMKYDVRIHYVDDKNIFKFNPLRNSQLIKQRKSTISERNKCLRLTYIGNKEIGCIHQECKMNFCKYSHERICDEYNKSVKYVIPRWCKILPILEHKICRNYVIKGSCYSAYKNECYRVHYQLHRMEFTWTKENHHWRMRHVLKELQKKLN